jgi:hypothetical protein
MSTPEDVLDNCAKQMVDILRADNPDDPQLEPFGDHLPLISLPPCGRARRRRGASTSSHAAASRQSNSCVIRIAAGRFPAEH